MTSKMPADVSLEGLRRGEPGYKVLYKFQSINEYSLDALRNGYLYFSSFDQLNDPFDPFIELVASHVGGITQLLAQKGVKIFCLTEAPHEPRMWAHYADSNRGMRIAYAVFLGNPRLFNPVEYVSHFTGSMDVLKLLGIKSKHWKYEREWRATMGGEDQKYEGIAHPVSVCLGPMCSTEEMMKVRAALPSTVTDFEISFPVIEHGVPCYATYDVDKILEAYGGIPRLSELRRS